MPVKISITGVLGSGKSAVCKELEKFGLKYFSTGLIQRGIAVEKGMTTLELNEYSETHPEIDERIDNELRKLSDSPDGMVIDSRMAWYFVKNTFKVFLWADETVAARRILCSERGLSEKYADEEQAKSLLKARKASENVRFKEKYGVDCGDYFNYDLVIDTTDILPDFTAGVIMEHCLRRNSSPVFLISPRCLYPTLLINEETHPALAVENSGPVRVTHSGGRFYIREGYRQVYGLFKSDRPGIVKCEIDGSASEDDTAISGYDMRMARAWEELNGFKYTA